MPGSIFLILGRRQRSTLFPYTTLFRSIGILLAIAIPNFVKARETSRAKSCIANLKQIDAAKEQWAMDNKAAATATNTKDRKSTRLNSSHQNTPYAASCCTNKIGAMGTN